MTVRTRSAVVAVGAVAVVALVGAGAPPAAAVASATGTVVVNGGGFGHGVGMSQWGAYGQALQGRTAEQIVQHYYTGTTVSPADDAMDLRVNLLHQVTSVRLASVSLGAGGGLLQVIPLGVAIETGAPGDVFTLTMSGASIVASKTSAGGVVTQYPAASAVTVRWAGTRFLAGGPTLVDVAGPGASLGDSSGRYRAGGLEVRVVGSAMEVNDVVRLHDEYLYGIAEVPSSWPKEALRAQVIASRSYALAAYAGGIRPACFCHIYGTSADQVFAGWSKQAESGGWGAVWTAAVDSTATSSTTGAAVEYAGVPVKAYYFAASGGSTRNSEDVWSSALPWARAVDDHWSQLAADPSGSWYRTFGSETVRTKLFPALPDLTKVLVTGKDAGGAVTQVTAWSAGGASATVPGSTFVSVLGLPSQWVWTAESNLPGQAVVDLASTPGYHLSGARQWRTDCHPYVAAAQEWAVLCTVNIVAYRYTQVGGTVVTTYDWVVNNVTYLDVDRPGWDVHPLAVPGTRTTSTGRPLKVTCTPSASTGARECRSWVYQPVLTRTASGFQIVQAWVFYAIVRLTAPPTP